MKIWKVYKDIIINKKYKDERKTFFLSYNKENIVNLEAISFASHHDTYKVLRGFSTPFFNKCYFFRKKKGFNTFFFKQNYDVVITDKNNIIIDTLINVKRGIISEYYQDGFNILFFVTGSINNLNLQKTGELLIKSNTSKLLFSDV